MSLDKQNDKIIVAEANGDFPFIFYIEKALQSMEGEDMVITGIASTANVDHDMERMSVNAMSDMANIINEKTVPLRLEHSKEDSAILGSVFKAWMDERNQLWIKARVDKNHPAGPILYNALKEGAKMGLSVGGRVKKAVKEMSEKTGQMVKTFYNVLLDEVSITQRPANYDAWLFAKSRKQEITAKDVILNREKYYGEFLFENQHMDYMRAFAKSIPADSWKEVNEPAIINNLIEDMRKNTKETTAEKAETTEETTETKKAEETTETKEKAEDTKETSKAEETETKEKAENTKETAKAEETETKEKAEDTKEDTKKAEETKEKATTEDEKFKSMVADGFATMTKFMESMQKATDDKKTDSETNEKAIEETKEKAETETKEKAEETKEKAETDETSTKEKADDKKDDTTTSEYAIKNSMKKMQAIMNKMEGKEETSDTVTKSETTIDQLVLAMAQAIDKISEKMNASGVTIPGFQKHIVDQIKSDPDIQAVIKEMMATPGFKKSVSMGVPYMTTKEGNRFALTASEMSETTIRKSQSAEKKSFKQVYKEDLASIKE